MLKMMVWNNGFDFVFNFGFNLGVIRGASRHRESMFVQNLFFFYELFRSLFFWTSYSPFPILYLAFFYFARERISKSTQPNPLFRNSLFRNSFFRGMNRNQSGSICNITAHLINDKDTSIAETGIVFNGFILARLQPSEHVLIGCRTTAGNKQFFGRLV